MPGAAQAITLSISLPGAAVASRGRSDGFARLLDDDATSGAPEPGDKTPALPGARQSGPSRHAVPELAAEAAAAVSLPTETAAAKKPAATDKGRQKSSPTRATGDCRKPSHDSQPDQVAAAGTVQPDASPAAPAVLPDPALPIAAAVPAGVAADHPQHAVPAVSALADAPAGPAKHEPHQAAATVAMTETHVANAVPQPTDAPAPATTPTAAILPAASIAQATPMAATALAAAHAPAQLPKADPVAHTAAPSPAPAVAPAITAISVAAHIVSPQHLIIHLTPPELGKLEVRIDRPADAPARVEIKVEHAHTLDLLSQDQPRLQQALDQAGVPANRHLVLTLSDSGSGGSGGSQPDGRAAFAARRGLDASGSGSVETELPDHQPRWARSALDITA